MGWPGPMTHRQYRAWQVWLNEERGRPNRTDYYLMQLTAEVRRGNVKNPRTVKMEHFLLNFTLTSDTPTSGPPPEAKKSWIDAVSGSTGVRVVKRGESVPPMPPVPADKPRRRKPPLRDRDV